MAPPRGLEAIAPQSVSAFAADTAAQQPQPLLPDVNDLPGVAPIVAATLRSDPGIPGAASRVRERISGVAERQSGYLPQVSAGLVSDLSGDDSASPELQLTGTQMVYDFGRTGRSVSRQVLLAQNTHLDFLESVDDALIAVMLLVADHESQTRQLALGRDRVARMISLRQLVADRSREGAETSGSLFDAERRVQTAETLLLRAELALASAQREIILATGTGLPADGPALPLTRLSCGAVPLEPDLTIAVKSALADLAVADIDVSDAATARLPTLELQASTGRDLSDLSEGSDIDFGLRLNTALYQGGATRSRNAAALANAAAAEASLAAARQQVLRAAAGVQDAIAAQRVLMRAINVQIDTLDQTRDLYLQQFTELGTKTIDDVLTVEEEYHQALLERETTRAEIIREEINCLMAEGRVRQFLGIADATAFGLALRQ